MAPNKRLPSSKQHATAGANTRGKVLDKAAPEIQWEVCTIWDVHPETQTYEIIGGSGGWIPDVRRLVEDPGTVGMLPRGTEVVVQYQLGYPIIQGVLKGAVTGAVELTPARVSEVRGVGGEDGVYARGNDVSNSRAPNDPVDVLAGDWARKSRHNNMIGVLAGGTNVVSSSPMAQIRTHGINDMVEVFANLYRHVSSLGNMEIINDGGKTSLIWRAGADQLTENGANVENWTLRLDAGKIGDLFRLSVTTPHNNTLCELHMSADGRLSLTGVAGVDISSGARGTAREDVAENKEVSVLQNMSTSVAGAVFNAVGGGRETLVGTNDSVATGNDLKETVGHDRLTHVSNNLKTTVEGGSPLQPPPVGSVAILWEAVNGGIESVTGNPANGATPTPKQSQNFVNYAGNFNFAIQPTAPDGKFVLISTGTDSVLLGANGAASSTPTGHTFSPSATHHVCMWEEFKQLADTMITWCDEHVHLTGMGPTGPASAGAVGPLSAKASSKVEPVKSTRVLVGG